jgi:dienelactone hydrolase
MPSDPIRVAPEGPYGSVPALVFVPDDPPARMPLVLLGHGAHLGKDDATMQLLCRALASVPAAVAIMDAPGHGERRPQHLTDEAWEADVVARMGDPAVHVQVLAEWPLVIVEARRAVPAASGSVGYAGFSMGSIFGLSIVGDLPEVRAALFAVGGFVVEERAHSNAVNRMIANGIAKLGDREVLMVNMTDDESFPIARAIEVLEAIPGPCSMHVYVGGHRDLPPASMPGMVRFLRRALAD